MKTRVVKYWHEKSARFLFHVEEFRPLLSYEGGEDDEKPQWSDYPDIWQAKPFDTQVEAEEVAKRLAGVPYDVRIADGIVAEFGE